MMNTEAHVDAFPAAEVEPIDVGYFMVHGGYVGLFQHEDRAGVPTLYVVLDDEELAYIAHCEAQAAEQGPDELRMAW